VRLGRGRWEAMWQLLGLTRELLRRAGLGPRSDESLVWQRIPGGAALLGLTGLMAWEGFPWAPPPDIRRHSAEGLLGRTGPRALQLDLQLAPHLCTGCN
jgi:hypothetical protein